MERSNDVKECRTCGHWQDVPPTVQGTVLGYCDVNNYLCQGVWVCKNWRRDERREAQPEL